MFVQRGQRSASKSAPHLAVNRYVLLIQTTGGLISRTLVLLNDK